MIGTVSCHCLSLTLHDIINLVLVLFNSFYFGLRLLLRLMCGSYVLQTTRSEFKNTQINSKCLLCGNAEETVEHYILLCETLEKFRNPILTKISETYLNLTGKEYRILDTRSKLQIIIDCSVLLSQESILNKRLKIQYLSSLEFHARRLTHVLHTNRYRLLNHPDQIE